MVISQAVKRFIRLETKEKYEKDNFDEVYYMLQHIIEYDIEAPGITGLSERLPYALNRIAEDSLSRQDILTFFPVIWQKFEPYVKKILYIIDSEGFKQYANNKAKTLPDYLKRLKVSYSFNVPRYKRSASSQAFCDILDLRNTESHDCEYWSITTCYERLSQTLLAYLFLTDHCLDKIKKAIKTGNLHTMIPLYSGERMVITCPSFINILRWIRDNPGVCFCGIKRLVDEKRRAFFNSDGILQTVSYVSEDYSCMSTYEWKTKNKNELLQIEQTGDQQRIRCKCLMNEQDEVIKYTTFVIKYDRKCKAETEVPREEWIVSYLSDGSVDLLCFLYEEEWSETDGIGRINTTKRLKERIHFNNQGLIRSVDRPYKNGLFVPEITYEYNDWKLTRIKRSNDESTRIETIGEEVFFWNCDKFTGDEQLVKKQIFKNKKLVESIDYLIDDKTNEVQEFHTSFEYYEEKDPE